MNVRCSHFTGETLTFLRELHENNEREWFLAHKDRYVDRVQVPALRFIGDFSTRLESISRHFVADPRPVGGSMFRIYRDVRFSRDKSPYKTHVGLQFRHISGKDVHAPGFYLGIEPAKSVAAFGIWHPDRSALRSVRDMIVDDPDHWREVVEKTQKQNDFAWYGESLVRAPKGYDANHPLIDDLKRKDFVLMVDLPDAEVISDRFVDRYAEICQSGTAFMRYLCEAVNVPF
jgi:uncharacterized protein (TIGR02453 family)